jgi:hypothetical protein
MNEDDLMWGHTYLQHAFLAGSAHQTTHRKYFLRHCSALSETVAYHVTTNFCYSLGHYCCSSNDDRTCICESPDAAQNLVTTPKHGVSAVIGCCSLAPSTQPSHCFCQVSLLTNTQETIWLQWNMKFQIMIINYHFKHSPVLKLISALHFKSHNAIKTANIFM